MAVVITETREGLRARREAIYTRLRMSADEFRALAEHHTLTGDECAARDELDQIGFLLGDDEPA